jgi:hypothetical protein
VFTGSARVNGRIPAQIRKSARKIRGVDPRDWTWLDRFMIPRVPEKANDCVVLSILGLTFAAVAAFSAVMMATRFSA